MSEIDYYQDIAEKMVSLLKANLESQVDEFQIGYGEHERLQVMLDRVGKELGSEQMLEDAKNALPLDLDVVLFIHFPKDDTYEMVIVEVKEKSRVGLMNYSQLTGYCLVSKAKYGLLVNVDGGMSRELQDILEFRGDLSSFSRTSNEGEIQHLFGVYEWESSSDVLKKKNVGSISSIPRLANKISSNK